MEGQQSKLTRTNSSLLRSSPTVRSSFHSLSSIVDVNEDDVTSDGDSHRRKPHFARPKPNTGPNSAHFLIVCALTLVITFVYLNASEITSVSENILLGLIFVAVLLFYLGKNRDLVDRTRNFIRVNLSFTKNGSWGCNHGGKSRSVQWYIGDDLSSSSPDVISGRIALAPQEEGKREGVEFYGNGDYYEGEFYKGKSNGSGVYNYYVKGRYEGEWIEGRYDGYGIESWAKGSRYRGQYRGGLRHGFGVYRFYTGDTYAGEWYNGQYHGVGVQSCSDGSCYVGEFKCGVKHGVGCYHFRNGDRYAGEYFGDKIHGFGVYHFANGHCYEGSWHEGRKQGYGMYTFRSGEAKCGEWDCGSLKMPLPPLTDSVLRAVQAARKAAENSINLRRVDEQVNKSVMGANRAATAARVAAVKAVQNRMDGKYYDTDA